MNQEFWPPFLFSLLAATVTVSGLLLVRRHEALARANSALLAAFAAGILLSAALLQLLPDALAVTGAEAPFFALAGYLSLYGLGLAFTRPDHVSHEERRTIALVPVLGIAIHSTLDGVVYSLSFAEDGGHGALAIAGLMLHEFPEGIIALGLLLRGGYSGGKAMLIALIATALTTPAGMLLSWPFLSVLSYEALALMMAFAAGALIYVSASHLMPHVEHEHRRGSGAAFLGGIVIAIAVLLMHRL